MIPRTICVVTYLDGETNEPMTKRFEGFPEWGKSGVQIGDNYWEKSRVLQLIVEDPEFEIGKISEDSHP